MLGNHAAYKYETPYKGQFVITQCCTNGMVALQCGAMKISIIYITSNHIFLIQMLKIWIQKLMIDDFILGKYLVYTSVFY